MRQTVSAGVPTDLWVCSFKKRMRFRRDYIKKVTSRITHRHQWQTRSQKRKENKNSNLDLRRRQERVVVNHLTLVDHCAL